MTLLLNIVLTLLASVLPACDAEDSTKCYWDADTRSNGVGVSFVDVGGTAYYWED